MSHSPRYQKIKAKISPHKIYSLLESLTFLQNNNSERAKGVKVAFTLNWAKQKSSASLKSKIILPYPLSPKGKIAVIKDDLPAETTKALAKKEKVELLSIEEVYQRVIIPKTTKIKKKSQWGFEKLAMLPQSEKKFKTSEKLPSKSLGLISRGVLLTENVLEAVDNFQKGEQEIKVDKGGNIHARVGESDYSVEQLEKNYQTLYEKINSLRPAKWKGNFLKKITLSTTMSPGLIIYNS